MSEEIIKDKTVCRAWVVFTGKTDIGWLRILKRGFRHCFVLLNDGSRWVSIDPLAGFTDVHLYHDVKADFNLPAALRLNGYEVIPANLNHKHTKPAPVMVFTCVESIKRILGIHSRLIVTPWQLYRHLKAAQKPDKFHYTEKGDAVWAH